MIRKYSDKDLGKLSDIWLQGCLQTHNFVKQDYWLKMLPAVKKYYLPNTEGFIFEDQHQLKGFISLIDDKYIGALFVAPKFQYQKIGSKLLQYVKRIYPELSLKVFTKNINAVRFYQKHGFKVMSEVTDESTKETQLLMSWTLECKTGCYKRYPGDS